jgi:hypothetical protein
MPAAPPFYIFFRIWLGFTDKFPFEEFDNVSEDMDIYHSLGVSCREWATGPNDAIRDFAAFLRTPEGADNCERIDPRLGDFVAPGAGLGSSIKQGVSDCRDECHAQEGLRARRH